MQIFSRPVMTSPTVSGRTYSDQEVADVLSDHANQRRRNWRFNLLRYNGLSMQYTADLTPWITEAEITHDTTAAVKRTMTMSVSETASSTVTAIDGTHIASTGLNVFTDWVQPVYRLGTPDGWLEFSLGCFMFTNPEVLLTGFMVQEQATLADATFMVSQVEATAGQGADSVGNPVSSNPAGLPSTVQTSTYPISVFIPGDAGIKLIDLITAMLLNPPDPNSGQGYVQADPLHTLPGVGLDPSVLDPNVFFSGGSLYSQLTALVPASGYTINPGETYLDTINKFLYYLNCYQLWATEGFVCPINSSIGDGMGVTQTVNGLSYYDYSAAELEGFTHWKAGGSQSSNGPLLTTSKWPANQNYNVPGVLPSFAYTTEQGVDLNGGVTIGKIDGSSTVLHFRDSIVMPGTTETLDLSQMANVIQVIIEDVGRDAIVFTLVNTNPASPISIAPSSLVPDPDNDGDAGVDRDGDGDGQTYQGNYRRVSKVVQDSGIPASNVNGADYSWAQGIANYEMAMATGGIDKVQLLTAVQPCHQSYDVLALNIYSDYVGLSSDGRTFARQHQPIVIGNPIGTPVGARIIPALDITQKFLETGWSVTVNLPTPGSGHSMQSPGVTTAVSSPAAPPGATMKHTLIRVSSITPDGTTQSTQVVTLAQGQAPST